MENSCRRCLPLSLIPALPAVSFLVAGIHARENYYPDISTALTTGEPDGIGPFAPVSVHDFPLGRAFVYGGQSPVMTGNLLTGVKGVG
jgi:hypothetical protein